MITVTSRFAFGITQEQINEATASTGIGPDNPPEGSLGPPQFSNEDGIIVATTTWEDEESFQNFVNMIGPALEEHSIPRPESVIS